MLKRFKVENFSSYRDKNYLDLTAGKSTSHQNHLIDFPKVKILKSAIVYGANASGKSNLIKALDYAREIILKDLDRVDTYKKYFRLDSECMNRTTTFEFELELDNQFFAYGFSLKLEDKKVESEWFYDIGKSKPEMIFERNNNSVELGRRLKKEKIKKRFEIYVDDMKNQSNQLFLNEIANKELEIEEVEILNRLYGWFDKKLIIIYPDTDYKTYITQNSELFKIFKKYLNSFDTGILDITHIEEDFEQGLKDMPKDVKEQVIYHIKENQELYIRSSEGHIMKIYKRDNELKVQKLGLLHSDKYREVFELKDESDGTKRLFDLIPLIGKFGEDYTIVIDEFDRSLHPKLARKLFELFYSIRGGKSQLIATTHESNLLDLSLLRKDEIVFAEKDKNGTSKLYSLAQFKVRYDKKIEQAYLLGRYGAIPIFKSFEQIDLEI